MRVANSCFKYARSISLSKVPPRPCSKKFQQGPKPSQASHLYTHCLLHVGMVRFLMGSFSFGLCCPECTGEAPKYWKEAFSSD
jgi:hypothetical protein